MHYYKNVLRSIAVCFLLWSVAVQAKCKKAKVIKRPLTVCGPITARCGIKDGNQAFGSFYNPINGAFMPSGSAIYFTNDSVTPIGIIHGPAPFSSFTITKSGVYYTAYKVRTLENFVISTALFRNDTMIPGSDDSGFTTTIENLLFYANAGDVITLRNIGPSFTAMSFSGSTTPITFVLVRVG